MHAPDQLQRQLQDGGVHHGRGRVRGRRGVQVEPLRAASTLRRDRGGLRRGVGEDQGHRGEDADVRRVQDEHAGQDARSRPQNMLRALRFRHHARRLAPTLAHRGQHRPVPVRPVKPGHAHQAPHGGEPVQPRGRRPLRQSRAQNRRRRASTRETHRRPRPRILPRAERPRNANRVQVH